MTLIGMTCSTPEYIESACSGLFCDKTDWDSVMSAARYARDTSLFTRSVFTEKVKQGWTLPEGAANQELLTDAVKAVGTLVSVVQEYEEGGPLLESWAESADVVLGAAKDAHCAGVYLKKLDEMLEPPPEVESEDDVEASDEGDGATPPVIAPKKKTSTGVIIGTILGVSVAGGALYHVATRRKR